MRVLMLIQFPIEPFNAAVKNGTVGAKMRQILDATKPEAAYFTERDGRRGGILVVNMDKASDIPRLAEPWFLTFNAEVEVRIAMTPEDLLTRIWTRWEKCGLRAQLDAVRVLENVKFVMKAGVEYKNENK
jgi:hypothetical protein